MADQKRRKEGRRRRTQAPKLLVDMRKVYLSRDEDGDEDCPAGEKALRNLLKERPREFLSQMAGLERTLSLERGKLKEKASGVPGGTPEKDEGEGRLLELIDRMLAEYKP